MSKAVSNRLVWFWEKGYFYHFAALILFLYYALNDRIGVMDWFKDPAYLHYITSALNDFDTLPYFWWNKLERISWIPPVAATSSFISIPETTLFSPLTPLIYFLKDIVFLKLYLFIHGLVGILGTIALRKRLNWNDIQFRTFSALFLFSPIIFQHIAIGYLPWYNIFFFPWLIYFLTSQKSIKRIIGISAVLSLVLLQGGVYVFVWFFMLIGLYTLFQGIFEKKWIRFVELVMVLGLVFLLAYVRIYATSLVYSDFDRVWFEPAGYNPINFLIYALIPTVMISPFDLFFWTTLVKLGIPAHDSGIFWGLAVFMVAILFIKYKNIFYSNPNPRSQHLNYKAVFFSAGIIFAFSFFYNWYWLMKGISSIMTFPFFESIKNYGHRLAIPAYLGFSLVMANYADEIWQVMHKFTLAKSWIGVKKFFKTILVLGIFGLGSLYLVLKLFTKIIIEKLLEWMTEAYNDSGSFWLRERMEGINENKLEFYLERIENIFHVFQYWLFMVLMFFAIIFVFLYLLKRFKYLLVGVVMRFPNLKFELLLALPLFFATSNWVALGTSVPFSERPRQEVLPPKITIINQKADSEIETIATPQSLKIIQAQDGIPNTYIFPELLANDRICLSVGTNNATLKDSADILILEATDDRTIEIIYKTKKIKQALWLTILSWIGVIVFFMVCSLRSRKLRDD